MLKAFRAGRFLASCGSWLIVLAIPLLLTKMPTPGVVWLVAGGLSYTVGVAFFATGAKVRYGHLLWHLFVMGGTICHYVSILWCVV
jgi:hemolysin III